jgi:hypothetical protein
VAVYDALNQTLDEMAMDELTKKKPKKTDAEVHWDKAKLMTPWSGVYENMITADKMNADIVPVIITDQADALTHALEKLAPIFDKVKVYPPFLNTSGTTSGPITHEVVMEPTPLVPVVVLHSIQNIKVALAPSEKQAAGQMLASLVVKRQILLDERKKALQGFSLELDALAQDIGTRAKILQHGVIEKATPVAIHMDYNKAEVRTYQEGTMKLVATRPMTEAEKQIPLELHVEQGATLKMPEKPEPLHEVQPSVAKEKKVATGD